MKTEESFAPNPAVATPDRPVIVVASGAFADGDRLVEHFDEAVLRFCDVSDPDKLAETTDGASGIVVTLQPLRHTRSRHLRPASGSSGGPAWGSTPSTWKRPRQPA